MFLSQKVGDLYHRSKGATFEQILEYEVTKETLVDSEKSIKASVSKVADTFDFANDSNQTSVKTEK
jgi:hypothetical protein